jgi:protease I
MSKLANKRVAILATHGFEESELFSPKEALENEGARVDIVSPEKGDIQAFNHLEKTKTIKVDVDLPNADINDYDALVIPGGLYNPDALRQNDAAIAFTRGAFARALPVASICHGPQVLISADLVKGRKMTGFSAIQIDLKNAGAEVSDEAVVVDNGLVTSRNPDDLDAFNAKLIEEICEGGHRRQKEAVEAA